MKSSKTTVSIGLPVFNGEKYLKETLDSLLAQTYRDFELIISDNASTDSTQQICQKYAANDSRIRYYRNEKNIGAPGNFNLVFHLSSGEYFKWAAADDVQSPTFLEKCVSILNKDRSVVLCYTTTGRIDKDGVLTGIYNEGILRRIDSKKPHERFSDLIGLVHAVCPLLGVGRSSAFAASSLEGTYIAADRITLLELGLMGRIHEIREVLFFMRDHPGSYSSTYYGEKRSASIQTFREEMAWWSKDHLTSFTHWKICREYFKSVNKAPISWSEKLRCYDEIFRWIKREGYLFLWGDLKFFMLGHSKVANKLIPPITLSLRHISDLILHQSH